jgi:hypothetical protein
MERTHAHEREEWITGFVNVVVWELCPGLSRMVAVTAARAAWIEMQGGPARMAASEWASKRSLTT